MLKINFSKVLGREVEVVSLPRYAITILSCLFFALIMVIPAGGQVTPIPSKVFIVPGASNPSGQIHYQPSLLTIDSTVPVTWENKDNTAHTVTSIIPPFGPLAVYDSSQIAPGGIFTYTFDTPGTFEYYCAIHPFMTGKITVK